MSNDASLSIQQRFERAVEARRSKRQADRPKFVDKLAEHEAQRQRWNSPNRTNTKPDASLVEARANWQAEQAAKKAASQAPQQITLSNPLTDEEEGILARNWANSNPDWYGSEFNVHIMKQIIEAFDLPHTSEGYSQAFAYGEKHHHFEAAPMRKRGFRLQHAPVPFNSPKPTAAPVQPSAHAGNTSVRILPQAVSPEEQQRLRGMSLEELRKEARSGMRAYNAKKDEQQ